MPELPALVRVFLALQERLECHERTGDAKAVWDPAAGAQAEALREFGVWLPKDGEWPPLVLDWDITHLLATWHYARAELDAAVVLFSLVHRVAPDAVPEALRERVSAAAPSEFADLPGLFALFLDAFARWEASGDADVLETAIRLARWGVAAVPDAHLDKPTLLTNLSASLRGRFAVRGDPADLAGAVAAGGRAVELAAVDHPKRALILHNYAYALHDRFGQTRLVEDLDAAIDLAREAVAIMPADDPLYPACLSNAGMSLARRFEQRGHQGDITEAVGTLREALRVAPPGNRPLRATLLTNTALVLHTRFRRFGSPVDLDAAVRGATAAVRVCPPSHPEAARCLWHLSEVLTTRFERSADPADIDAAVDAGRRAVRGDAPERSVMLIALASALRARAKRTGSADDIDEAVALLEQAGEAIPEGHPATVSHLSELGSAYTSRFQHTADPADLDKGIAATERSVELAGQHHPHRVIGVADLAARHWRRFVWTGDVADLHAAIDRGREAVRTTPDDHENRAVAEFELGRIMEACFEHTGSLADLDEAVQLMERAERRAHADEELHAMLLSHLGVALRIRYERLDRPADGDRAIELTRRAVDLSTADHPDRAIYLSNLAAALTARCNRTGAAADIEAAVEAGRHAVRLASERVNRAADLANLANVLHRRYEQTFALSDLEEAIQTHRSAIDAAPADHPFRPVLLSNLSVALMSRFTRTEDPAVVDEMIELARSAVEATPAGHAARPRHLSHYAAALHLRHARTKDPEDANAGLAAIQEAVRLIPDDHPSRMLYLGNLAVALDDRYAHSLRRRDLATVIKAGRAAVRAAPAGHPLSSRFEYNLGRALVTRAGQTGSPTDVNTAIGLFRDVARTATAPTALRIRAARRWGDLAGGLKRWAEAVAGYRAAIELLPLLAWHGLEREDRVSALAEFAGLASTAAAAALMLNEPGQALQLLEQGRGVLLAQALDARGDLSELAAVDPDLAERMRAVRAELDSGDTPAFAEEDTEQVLGDRRRGLAREWDTLLTRARTLPGLADFLRLPPLERLRTAAADGPVVVVNIDRRRCDALIVTATGLSTLPLPGLDAAEVRDRATTLLHALAGMGDSVAGAVRARQVLDQVLGWLWDTVAEPVLAALPSEPGRLWWCPTGLLTFLPVHAAGHHGSGSRRTVLDRVICSYTPTLRALAEARTRPPAPTRMLAVSQPATPGLSPLPNALTEVRRLASRVPGTTTLSGDAATREAVLTALPDYTCLHFAGHGGQNPRVTVGGALYCADHQSAGPITVADIAGRRLDSAELVFLSACETARGVITVPDEAVHMAGALQLAGFTHVVATQWLVSDTHAADIADHFYASLADESASLVSSRAAAALHTAVRRLRAEHADPLRWASYVHTGP